MKDLEKELSYIITTLEGQNFKYSCQICTFVKLSITSAYFMLRRHSLTLSLPANINVRPRYLFHCSQHTNFFFFFGCHVFRLERV